MLWNQPIGEVMPFFGIGLIMWNFLSQVLTECTSIFVTHGHIYRNQWMNFSVSVFSVIYRNTVVLAHNLIIVVVLIAVFGVPVNECLMQIVPALVLTWITLTRSGYLIATMCVRYRDVVQIITNWLQVLFFLTPVLWKPELLPPQYRFIVDYNPLAQFLDLLRNPFLGQPIEAHTWYMTLAVALLGGALSLPVIGRYRRRVIFWV